MASKFRSKSCDPTERDKRKNISLRDIHSERHAKQIIEQV